MPRAAGQTVGLVPTMGYFHAGHASLMAMARATNDVVIVSSFVNPTQFGPTEDLAAYPCDAASDEALAATAGVDVLFAPSVAEMYPEGGGATTVHVAGLTDGMCGTARPTHFDGVTTVVAKLFSIVGPCEAYFGRKDYQQLAVVRRMSADLDLPVTVVGAPIVREADGLAMSSRNAYLTPDQRRTAPALHQALLTGAEAVVAGQRAGAAVTHSVREALQGASELDVEYVELRDADTLVMTSSIIGRSVLAAAVRLGSARLIDNLVITVDEGIVDVDAGVRLADGTPPASTP